MSTKDDAVNSLNEAFQVIDSVQDELKGALRDLESAISYVDDIEEAEKE